MGAQGDLSTCVRVAVRLRPRNASELATGGAACVEAQGNSQLWFPTLSKANVFEHVFGPESTQASVFLESAEPLVQAAIEGYNATILAYGQTGSGKTFTMGANPATLVSPVDKGILPRAIEALFTGLSERTKEEDSMFTVSCSFLEIYNEEIQDLLGGIPEQAATGLRPRIVEEGGKISVQNICETPVAHPEEALLCLEQGGQNRCIGATLLNSQSSRSHAIFTLNLEQRVGGICTLSKFNFVDLGGSERVKRTQATGNRLQEGIAINQGLLSLGNVINSLTEKDSSFVPYRQSKLTRMLQDSLGGSARTLLIACISPAAEDLAETYNTVRYASRARNIRNQPVVQVAGRAGDSVLLSRVKALEVEVLVLRAERARWRTQAKSVSSRAQQSQAIPADPPTAPLVIRALLSPRHIRAAASSSTAPLVSKVQRKSRSRSARRRCRSRSAATRGTSRSRSASFHSAVEPSDTDLSDQVDEEEDAGQLGSDKAIAALLENPDLVLGDHECAELREFLEAGTQRELCADELESLVNDLQSKAHLYKRLESETGRFGEEFRLCQKGVSEKEIQLRKALAERDSLQKQLKSVKCSRDKSFLEKQVADLQRKIDRQQTELQRVQEERVRLLTRRQEGEQQLQHLTSEMSRLRIERTRAEKQHQAASERTRQLLAKQQGLVAQLTRKAQSARAQLSSCEQRSKQQATALLNRNRELLGKVKFLQQMQQRRVDSRTHRLRRVGVQSSRIVAGVPMSALSASDNSDSEAGPLQISHWLREAIERKLDAPGGAAVFNKDEVQDLVKTCALNLDMVAEALIGDLLASHRGKREAELETELYRKENERLRAAAVARAAAAERSDVAASNRGRTDFSDLDRIQRANRLAAEKRTTTLRSRPPPSASEPNAVSSARPAEKENKKPAARQAWSNANPKEPVKELRAATTPTRQAKTPRRCTSERQLGASPPRVLPNEGGGSPKVGCMSPKVGMSPKTGNFSPEPERGRSVFARLQQDVGDRRLRAQQAFERARDEESLGFNLSSADHLQDPPFLRPGAHRRWGDEDGAEVPEAYLREVPEGTGSRQNSVSQFSCMHRLREAHNYFVSSCCLAWGEVLYSGSLSAVKRWQLTPTGPTTVGEVQFPDTQRLVRCIQVDDVASGSGLLAVAVGSTARLHDPRSMTRESASSCTIRGSGEVSCVSFLPGSAPLLAVAADKAVRVYDIRSMGGFATMAAAPVNQQPTPVQKLETHSEIMALEASSTRLVAAGRDRYVRYWTRQGGDVSEVAGSTRWTPGSHRLAPPHNDTVQALLWYDQETLLSASRDRHVRAWRFSDGAEDVGNFATHHDWLTALARLQDGRILTACRDGTVRLWSIRDPDRSGAGISLTPSGRIIRHSAASVNGLCAGSDFFVSVSSDRSVAVWREDGADSK